MKITQDQISGSPGYGISKSELMTVWRLIPHDWNHGVRVIRLCNQLHTPEVARYSAYSSRLTIFPRGRSRRTIIIKVLEELASWPHPFDKLSADQKTLLSNQISTVVASIDRELALAEQGAS